MFKRCFLSIVFITMFAGAAAAQDAPKSFVLTVDSQDLQALSAGISELPYKVAAPLIAKLQAQIVKQQEDANGNKVKPAPEPK